MEPVRLNLTTLKSLVKSPPSGTKQFLWDLEVPGFGAYMTSKLRVSFVYQYRMRGEQTQSIWIGYLGEHTVEQARDIASDYAHQRRKGINPLGAIREKIAAEQNSVELVIRNYVQGWFARRALASDPVSPTQKKVFQRDLVDYLGDVRLDKLTVAIVEKFQADLFARGPSMVRSGLVCLRAILNNAVKRGKIVITEAHAFDVPKTGKRNRRLTDDELQRLIEAARDIGDVRSDVIEVIVRMGKRKEEIAGLPWHELDLAKRQWKLPAERNKSKRPWLILLPPQVVSIIERQQPDPKLRTGFVFTLNGKSAIEMGSQVKDLLDANMQRRVELAEQRDGIARKVEHFTIHDIRKVVGSTLQEDPFLKSNELINSMLLHVQSGEMDSIYLLSPLVKETGAMVADWNDHIDRQLATPTAWPGGRDLPSMSVKEQQARIAAFREGWPERADQIRARERREQGLVSKRRRKK